MSVCKREGRGCARVTGGPVPDRPRRARDGSVPRRRGGFFVRTDLLLGCGALLLAMTAVGAGIGPEPARAADSTIAIAPVDTLFLPSAGVRGIAFGPDAVWVLQSTHRGLSIPDSTTQAAIARLDLRTGLLDTLVLTEDAFVCGLAHDDTTLWAGGARVGEQPQLYRIETSQGRMTGSLPAAGFHPGGLVWDDQYLWQVDSDARQIVRIETAEGKVSRRVATPGFYPTGLAYDGYYFWCADAATGRIDRIRAYNGRADGHVDTDLFLRRGTAVTLGFDGQYLWVSAVDEPWIVRYEILR